MQKCYNFHPSQKQTQQHPPKHGIAFLEILSQKKSVLKPHSFHDLKVTT